MYRPLKKKQAHSLILSPQSQAPAGDAWQRMDYFGAAGIPFFFLSDFTGQSVEVLPLDGLAESGVFFDFRGKTNIVETPPPLVKQGHFEKYPIPYERYLKGFDLVKKHIQAGNSFLVNYTCATPIATDLDLWEIFCSANARYKVFYKDQFTFFSPETFVTIADGRISTCPMKGTIDAGLPDARQLVLADPKEAAEHHTIVDLLRNDLSQVARQVTVERFRYVEEVRTTGKHLLQVSSEITGQLPTGWQGRLGSIFQKLLPAGSVSGAPKKKTVEIIGEAEEQERGYYTGVAGLFDGEKLDSGVAIRFIEKTQSGLVFRSGGGITCQSEPRLEYQEMIDKVYLTQPALR